MAKIAFGYATQKVSFVYPKCHLLCITSNCLILFIPINLLQYYMDLCVFIPIYLNSFLFLIYISFILHYYLFYLEIY